MKVLIEWRDGRVETREVKDLKEVSLEGVRYVMVTDGDFVMNEEGEIGCHVRLA